MGPRFGFDRFQQSGARYYYQEQRAGTWEINAPTTHVRDLTGRDPEDFATIARRYARRPDAQRTPRNLLRSLWDMTCISLIPPPRLDHFIATQQHPQPSRSTLSAHSETWRSDHGGPTEPGTV